MAASFLSVRLKNKDIFRPNRESESDDVSKEKSGFYYSHDDFLAVIYSIDLS